MILGSPREIAKALGGEVSGGHVLAPGPGHSRLDRSMRVFLDAAAPDGFTATSFAGDDWRNCRDYIKGRLGIANDMPRRPQTAQSSRSFTAAKSSRTSHDKSDLALAIWGDSHPITGTLAESYLVRRIGRMMAWPIDLAFNPRCPRGDQKLPALVALLRDIHTDTPRAIQRIFLKPDGSDRLRDNMGKATLGPAAGAVCKLVPDEHVTMGLGVIEGVEKGLAILATGWSPVWATCGTSGMAAFPALSGIEGLTIFADNDQPGMRAAETCAARWTEAGHCGRIIAPKVADADWSDALAVPA